VKSFLKSFADEYPIEVVFCGGDPRFVIMDSEGKELETIEIDLMNEIQIKELIESKGFKKF
jgi:hypothetical protein